MKKQIFNIGKRIQEIVKEKGITDAELGRILWFVDSGIRIEVIEMEKTFNRVIRWSTSENSNHFAFHDIGLLIEYLQNSYKKMIDIQKKRNNYPEIYRYKISLKRLDIIVKELNDWGAEQEKNNPPALHL